MLGFRTDCLAVLLVFCCVDVSHGQNEPDSLPLHLRTPDQRVLLIMGGGEREAAVETCKQLNLGYELADRFDRDRNDYSGIFAIIAGSNRMDYFGSEETKSPEAFDALERFVSEGGHLFLFGTYNGRNCGHLKRFGIITGIVHVDKFRMFPGRSEVFFHGSEELVPDDLKANSSGNFRIVTDYITLLRRPEGPRRPDDPALATLRHGLGRVTYTQVQPYWRNDLWLVPIAVRWIARGAPTTLEQLGGQVVYDKQTYERLARRLGPLPPREELAAAEAELRKQYAADLARTSPREKIALAARLRKFAETEPRPVTKYSALQISAHLLLEAGQFVEAVAALNQSATLYEFDRLAAQSALLEAVPYGQLDAASAAELARICLNLAEDAADVHAYNETRKLLNIALLAATSANHPHYRHLSQAGIQRVEPLISEFQAVLANVEELRRQADVPQAMSRLGRFYALTLEDWQLGLPYLQDGPAGPLRELAELELAVPTTSRDCERLGDKWIEYAGRLPGGERQAGERRAAHWYRQGLENAPAADRAALRKKLAKFPSTRFELQLTLELEGSGELEITAEQLHWNQISEAPPARIEVDGQTWDVQSTTVLPNRGATRYLPEGVNFTTARVKKRQGRGLATLKSASSERAIVRLNDLPRGADTYRIAIEFGE